MNKERKPNISRTEFRKICQLGLVILGILSMANGTELWRWLRDKKFEEVEKEMDTMYGLPATATVQSPEIQQNITGKLFKASGIIIYDGQLSGCSTTIIGKDTEAGLVYLLTAGHCISNDFQSLTIVQPQLNGGEAITVGKNKVNTVIHPEYQMIFNHYKKDLAVIAVNSWEATEMLETVDYELGKKLTIKDKLCAMAFPAFQGVKGLNDWLAIETKVKKNIFGKPARRGNGYILDTSAWPGESGTGVGICNENKIVGVLVSGDFMNGTTQIEMLDKEIEIMIKTAQSDLLR